VRAGQLLINVAQEIPALLIRYYQKGDTGIGASAGEV